MLAFANAKINLGLNVIEKRPDGYHNLETVFYPVKIFDTIEITDAETTFCEIRGVAIPGDSKDNLCLQAYNLLKKDFGLPPQQITLLKNIPVGAGLGGGSADAAFLIKLINDKFKLGLSVNAMEDYARVLGADCAFFIANKPVYATERGDQFKPVDIDLSSWNIVLVKPPVHVSTADAFGGLKPASPAFNLKELMSLPPDQWKEVIKNDFEETIFRKYPEIAQLKADLYHAGATFALMSGSGSSVFAIFDHPVTLPGLEQTNRVFYDI